MQLASNNSCMSTTSFEVFELENEDCGELSCAHLNREWKVHTKSHELISAFLACPPD